jgi:multiple antibiotic resistance protein
MDALLTSFILLWAVIDPIGTVPIFIAVTRGLSPTEKKAIALKAALVAAGILLFFIVVGEILLRAMGVPLLAFQITGGCVLFLFALTMIFGESKPEGEMKSIEDSMEKAIFPLAIPSIASPGAIMAVVLLTDNSQSSIPQQAIIVMITALVIITTYALMRGAGIISKIIGKSGAIIVSKVMGLILASIAATQMLEGLKAYF